MGHSANLVYWRLNGVRNFTLAQTPFSRLVLLPSRSFHKPSLRRSILASLPDHPLIAAIYRLGWVSSVVDMLVLMVVLPFAVDMLSKVV